MANYLNVSSSDTLSHLALPGSPETLCGRLVVDEDKPNEWAVSPNPNTDHTGDKLICDVCASLSGGDSFVKETVGAIVEAGRACPSCEDGFDSTGAACWNCDGTGWLDEGDSYDQSTDLSGFDTENLRGTRVAFVAYADTCDNCGESSDVLKSVGNEWHCTTCATAPVSTNTDVPVKTSRQSNVEKIATNWTRDGVPIENGFEVMITKEQAARTPFLDFARVGVSELRECPDCHTNNWLTTIASCDSCGKMKCRPCMDTIGLSSFVGNCKKCASAASDEAIEWEYEDAVLPDQGRYLSYYLRDDAEEEGPDPLFLPYES